MEVLRFDWRFRAPSKRSRSIVPSEFWIKLCSRGVQKVDFGHPAFQELGRTRYRARKIPISKAHSKFAIYLQTRRHYTPPNCHGAPKGPMWTFLQGAIGGSMLVWRRPLLSDLTKADLVAGVCKIFHLGLRGL